jgi:hypothetical protein
VSVILSTLKEGGRGHELLYSVAHVFDIWSSVHLEEKRFDSRAMLDTPLFQTTD